MNRLRTPDEIKADPGADFSELLSLDFDDQVRHPNAPLTHVLYLVMQKPDRALLAVENPSFILWELEDASSLSKIWEILCNRAIDLIESHIEWKGTQKLLFAAECAAEVLPLFEAILPNEDAPRKAILASLRVAVFPSEDHIDSAGEAARNSDASASDVLGNDPANYAVNACANLAWEANSHPSSIVDGVLYFASRALFGRVYSRLSYTWLLEKYRRAEEISQLNPLQFRAEAVALMSKLYNAESGNRVGARKIPTYKDPEASWEQIKRLPRARQVVHPNIPLEEAIRLVNLESSLAPLLLQNPSFDLWTLMEPGWLDALLQPCKSRLAKDPTTPAFILIQLSKMDDIFVKEGVASNVNAPQSLLEELALSDTWMVRSTVAENRNTPIQALRILSRDTVQNVRMWVALNRSTPTSLLKSLAKDEDANVRHQASLALLRGSWP